MLAALLLDLQTDALDVPALAGATVAAYVRTLDGDVLFERNADLLLIPASNQKLLTAAYAWDMLGPDWRAETRIWREAKRLVVECVTGDPTLTAAQLQSLAKRLALPKGTPAHVRQPYAPGIPPGWEYDDLRHRYAPSITALTVDRGGFEVRARAGKLVVPAFAGVGARHVPGAEPATVEYDRPTRSLVVRGALGTSERVLDTLSLPSPAESAVRLLGAASTHPTTSVPKRAPTAVIRGPALREVFARVLTHSDNHHAEHLLLMTAHSQGPLGADPYATAARRLRAFLTERVGLDPSSVRPVDGSGLSRHNLVSARTLVQTMAWLSARSDFADFAACLAAPGAGTLQGRLDGSSVRGKTGTLDAVVALSGWIETTRGPAAASVIVNGAIAPAAEVRAAVDAFLRVFEPPPLLEGELRRTMRRAETLAPQSGIDASARDRLRRSVRDGAPARAWAHRRAQPAHATANRTLGVAIRVR